jgi:hypothetical protein
LADAYDANLYWIANRPWIHGVTLESILATKSIWTATAGAIRGTSRAAPHRPRKLSHNYVNNMTRLDYDNWYVARGWRKAC